MCINFQHIEQEYHELKGINHARAAAAERKMIGVCGAAFLMIYEHIVTRTSSEKENASQSHNEVDERSMRRETAIESPCDIDSANMYFSQT